MRQLMETWWYLLCLRAIIKCWISLVAASRLTGSGLKFTYKGHVDHLTQLTSWEPKPILSKTIKAGVYDRHSCWRCLWLKSITRRTLKIHFLVRVQANSSAIRGSIQWNMEGKVWRKSHRRKQQTELLGVYFYRCTVPMQNVVWRVQQQIDLQ